MSPSLGMRQAETYYPDDKERAQNVNIMKAFEDIASQEDFPIAYFPLPYFPLPLPLPYFPHFFLLRKIQIGRAHV